MIDFDNELQLLFKKYQLVLNDSVSVYEKEILKIWNNIPPGKKIALWGAGEHTNELFMLIDGVKADQLVCLIEKNTALHGTTLFGLPIYPPDYLTEGIVDSVVVSSFTYRNELLKELAEKYHNCEAVDLYRNVEAFYNYPFYSMKRFTYFSDMYYLRKMYESCDQSFEKEHYLHELIIRYLSQKDFVHADKYIKEYIQNGYSKAHDYSKFLGELNELLFSIKSTLKAKTNKDILLLIVDSLRQKDITTGTMPFTMSLSDHGISFEQAFSTSTYTRACYISMFTGKLIIDDKRYEKKEIYLSESELLCKLSSQGYLIRQFGGIPIENDILQDKMRFTYQESIEHSTGPNVAKDARPLEPVSNILWRYLCDATKQVNSPTFSVVHIMETHFPFICSYHERKINVFNSPYHYYLDQIAINFEETISQHLECIKYIDEQFKYYFEFLSDETIQIICGDHGTGLGGDIPPGHMITWHEDVIHVPLIIYGRDLLPQRNAQLFGMNRFGEQLLYILESGTIKDINMPFIQVQRDAVYNKDWRQNKTMVDAVGKYMQAFKVIRTKTDKYVLYEDGREEYYKLPDETNNLIHNERYQRTINQIRKQIKNSHFPNKN